MANETVPSGARVNGFARKEGTAVVDDPIVQKKKLDSLLDLLPVGVFTIGPDNRIRVVNAEAARLAGFDPETAVGKTCKEVLECSFCGPTCAADEARKTGQPQHQFPVDVVKDDGSPLSVVIDAVALGDGDVAVTMRDVTDAERQRRALKERWVFHGLVGVSSPMKDVVSQVRDVAPYDSTVLVLGERGTGKEQVARAIHAESPRAERPFAVVDVSAYSENLLESELFGHARGAFPGADRDRAGRFETAEGGTLFLDDVAALSPRLQQRLLRALQDREFVRMGETKPRAVSVRLLAATDKDLTREVREGRFREDLFHRLGTFTLRLPPLRDRKEDLLALVDHLTRRVCVRSGKAVPTVAEDAKTALLAYAWPGNVRELEGAVEIAVARCHDGVVHAADLPPAVLGDPEHAGPKPDDERVRAALYRAAGGVTLAAKLLGVHRTTLWRWMRETGLKSEDFRPC